MDSVTLVCLHIVAGIASGLSVQRLPPVAITPLLIVWVTLSADYTERSGGGDRDRTYCDISRKIYSLLPYHYGGTSIVWKSYGESNPASQDENLMS